MPKLASRILCVLAAIAATLSAAPAAFAVDTPFSTRFAQTIRGDIRAVGNTSMTCPASFACTNGRNGAGASTDDNDFNMVNVNVDADATTFNSSASTVSLPAGSTVAWAGLYWGADTSAGVSGAAAPSAALRDTVRFNNGSGYQTISASAGDVLTSTPQPTRYRAFRDVTALMTATGNGTYTVANVQAGTGQDRFAGWALIVAYVDSTLPFRRVSVWDGLGTVDATHTFSTNIAPFFTPASGAITTNVGLLSFEGDHGIASETMSFAGSGLSDGLNPANNGFNSTIANNGAHFTAKNPNYVNQMGTDLDSYTRTGLLTNLQSSATLSFSSTQDYFMPSMLYLVSDEGPSVNTSAPTIGGVARDGAVLTASPGTWLGTPTITYGYQWQRCDVNGLNCVNIAGQTGTTYTLTPADVGSTIRVVVIGTNDAGDSAPATSNQTATVVQEAPANVTPPQVNGVTNDGETLTAGLGTWTGTAPLSYAYQWLRCDAAGNNCVNIPGATAGTYDLTASDVGRTIRVDVTASNNAGSATSTSPASTLTTADPPDNTTPPQVSGTTQDGSTLGVNLGTWTGTAPLAYTYQWERCDAAGNNCVDIVGATSSTYDLAAVDIGSTIRIEVTATNVAGVDVATSTPSSLVVAEPPSNTTLPQVNGTTQDGETLSVNLGTWTGTDPLAYDYQWLRCDAAGASCVDIVGADSPTYDLTPADVGSTIRVEVTATNAAGDDTATSAPSSLTLADPPVNTALPQVNGSTQDGETLSVDLGTWTGTDPLAYDYQWLRCDAAGLNCVPIVGADQDTYDLTDLDVGSTIRIEVTANNAAGSDSATSAPSSLTLADPPVNTALPQVNGSTQDGSTLSIDLGTWTGTAPLAYGYQWLRCDAAGANCVPIAGADQDTYDLTPADIGSTIRIEVTATNAAGSDTATSAPSSLTLADPPVNTALPQVTGTTQDGSTLSIDLGTWTGTDPLAYDYQWLRCDAAGANCVPIVGADSPTYDLTPADVGSTIRVEVTATNVAGDDTATSPPSSLTLADPPVNTALPQVTGSTQDGETLSVDLGTWTGTDPLAYDYQWLRCDAAGANCVPIVGADQDTYDLTPADVGSTIRVEVTATNAAGDDTATSAPSTLTLAEPPANTTLPQVTGTTLTGSTLAIDLGTWTGTAPLDYDYQWQRCDAAGANCVDIAGADEDTYDLTDGDIGFTIRVEVTANNAAGSDTATSPPSSLTLAEPPVNTTLPQVNGTTQDGETLSIDLGTWSGTAPLVYTYQWVRCDAAGLNCVPIAGADEATYDLSPADVGSTIRVEVTATNAAGDDTATSPPSSLAVADPPVNTALPQVTGSTVNGETLSIDLGTWSGTDPLVYTYQWQRCDALGLNCVDIAGADQDTYDLTPTDIGSTLRVEVTATNAAGDDTATSSPSPLTVAAFEPPVNTTPPLVTGTPQEGATLSVDLGDWTGTAPLVYTYQWQRCDAAGANCVDIAGADQDTYGLAPADIGSTIRIEVTATNAAGDDTATSTPSPLVTAEPPVNTTPPQVTGTTQDGETLSIDLGTWTGTDPLAYTYQWQRCDAAGANCVDIAGADEDTYDLADDDIGSTIRVEVTATNAAGDDTATSAPSTVTLADPLANTLVPTITGVPTNGETLTADPGTWTGNDPIGFEYQWQLCDADGSNCVDIVGADQQTYDIVPGDVGHVIRVVVTADDGSTPVTASSATTAVVGLIPPVAEPSDPPVLSGTTLEGETLTADPGEWSGDEPIVLTYQWQRCDVGGLNCVDISGATGDTYDLADADVGRTIVVVVTGTNDAGSDEASSAPSAVVLGLPEPPVSLPSDPPVLSGTTVEDRTLTADPGDWNGDAPIVFTYQWQRCDAAGLNCVDIVGATDDTYVLTSGDVGHTIVVVVTGTNATGSDSAASAPSSVVTAVPVPDPDPDPDPDPGPDDDPPAGDPAPQNPPVVVAQSDVLADAAQLTDLGTVSGNLVAEASCQQLAGNSKYRRLKLAGIGTVRLRAYTSGPAMKLTPMQVSTQVTGGKAKSVKYTLDGKALKAKKAPRYMAAITPAQLKRVGTHTLKAMVKGKKGKPKPVVLTLKTVPCKTLFTAQRWTTTAGAGLRLRVDARTALQKISFKVPAALLPKQTTKVRKVGFVRFFIAGQPRKRFELVLPRKGTKPALLSGTGKPSISYTAGGLEVAGVPASAAVAELTFYRVTKLDKPTKPRVFKLSAQVLRASSPQERFSARPKAPR